MGVVGFAEGCSEIEGSAYLSIIGNAGGGGAVEVVVAVGSVFVVVAALEVDVGRKTAVGVGFGVLVVFPGYFEVTEFAEGVAVAGDAFFGDAVSNVEVAFVFVAFVVVAAGFGCPAEVGIDFADEGEVDVVVECEVVATVFKIVAAVVHPSVAGHEDAGGSVVGHGEEGEGEDEWSWNVLDGDVGGAGEDFVAGDEFGVCKVDGEVGMGVVAGGVLATVEVHDGVADFLDARAVKESVALLGDDTGDDAFAGVVVEGDGVGHVFVVALFEEGTADYFAVGVGNGLCIEYLAVEVDVNGFGFEFHAIIFDDTLRVELGFAFVDVDGYGVGGLVVDDAGECIWRGVYDGEGVGACDGIECVGNGVE